MRADEQALILKDWDRKRNTLTSVIFSAEEERIMRTLAKMTLALSFIGAMAIGSTAQVQAQGFYLDAPGVHIGVGDPYYYRRYYNSYGGWRTWNGCPPDWTIQGGVCKPYRHGPWDWNPWYR
jgi:hypothetical protein